MLEAANGAGANTVKRLVITSSANAIIPYSAIISPDPTKIWDGNWRNPDKKGPYEDVSDAYRAGKSMALNASERFIKENNPAFDIISIAPTFIIGANELVTDRASALQSSNYFVLKPVSGLDASYAPTAAIHLHDTALAHVRALDPKIPGNQVFVMNVIPNWTDMFQIVKREFPEAVKSGQLPNNGNIIPVPITADGSRTEEVLGIKFRSYEEMVKNVVAHYISLSS
jgi:nucleoside-diphosphate-sugar epimerase